MCQKITIKISFFAMLFMVFSINTKAQNLALTATAAHSGGGATTYAATNYNDGIYNACNNLPWGWVSTNGWIEYTWGSTQNITKVVFRKDNRPMTTCVVEYWNGSAYTTIMNYSGSACDDSITFAAVSTTKLRFNTVGGSSNPNHREIEVYGISCSTDISNQPVSKTICEGENTTFAITAIDVTNYQWQVNEGSGFFDVTNNTVYSGATTNTLTITSAPFSANGNQYRCMASKSICKDTSTVVSLTVNGLVKSEGLPLKDTSCINATKDITTKTEGSILSYRWQIFITGQGYVDVPNAPPYIHMGNTLRIAGVPDTLDGSIFRLLVDGICDSTATNDMQLTVNVVPQVAVPPSDVLADHGDNVMFEIQASAAGAKYQWQVAAPDTFVNINDGGIYAGAKTNRLTVIGVSRVQDNFKFRCVVRSGAGCNAPGDTSDFGILNVNPPLSVGALTNDDVMVLYPNPTGNSDLFIKTKGSLAGRELKYKVVDKTGRTIIVGNVSGNDKTRVDVGRLAADIYVVEIIAEGNETVAKSRFTKL